MLIETSVDEQLRLVAADPLRVLVVGAGVAGVTLTQLLRKDGLHPVLIDRAAPDADPGYMLALMPMVDPAIDALGVRNAYGEASIELAQFRFRSHRGRPLRQDSLDGLLEEFGDYRGIGRAELMRVLASAGGGISHRASVAAINGSSRDARHLDRVAADTAPAEVELSTADGSRTAAFDLVVAADGIGSGTRRLILADEQVQRVDTGWGGWVGWIPSDAETEVGEELWGAGFFIGSYPVADRIGVFVGGPRTETAAGPAAFVDGIRARLDHVDGRIGAALNAVSPTESLAGGVTAAAGASARADRTGSGTEPYFWSLADCRAATWSVGRVVLLGDAAAGFLPTAGIGAGMAMESAWVLAGHLHGVTPGGVRAALAGYEQVQRPRVESAQQNSRTLARLMFRRSRLVATLRDRLFAVLSVEAALRPIRRLLQHRPQPTPPARSESTPRSAPTRRG